MNDTTTHEGQTGASAGALLRQARQAAGMDIAVLASALKVPVSKLQALENDDFAVLPDAVFARALASSVCRTLKVDPAPVLGQLPQSQAPRLVGEKDGLNAKFKDPQDKAPPLRLPAASRGVSLAVLVLLAGAAAVYFLPSGMLEFDWARTPAPEPVHAVAEAFQEGAAVAEATQDAGSAVPAQPSASDLPLAAPAAPASQATAAPMAAASVAPAAVAAASSAVLEFRASAESWVQVRDASGAVVFERTLKAGESAQAPGKPPLAVVVGRAHATEVMVRGVPFDLAAVARENVARFEVK
ncbi:MAG: helix-turn-helix domain-containing protein [Comamonadaceae bacterium]|nr:helix-turn-helix domain-containing protein [Comamonadaceae bacterium]